MGERIRQLDPRVPGVAITLPLATLHTTLLVLVVLGLVYAFGDLGGALDGLSTFAGLGLFVYLWAIVWVTTAGALRRLEWPRAAGFEATADAALRWGAVTGAASLLVAASAIVGGATVYGILTLDHIVLLSTAIFVPFAIIGGVFALAFGAFFGAIFGLVDYVLFVIADAAVSGRPSDTDAA
jgi:hypothetical protein